MCHRKLSQHGRAGLTQIVFEPENAEKEGLVRAAVWRSDEDALSAVINLSRTMPTLPALTADLTVHRTCLHLLFLFSIRHSTP